MTASDVRGVRFEADGAVGRIVLSRPAEANAMDIPATLALGVALDEAERSGVSSVVLTAEGKRFCAGGDVASFARAEDPSGHLLELATLLEAEIKRLSRLPQPVVAAVHGAVAGAGLSFVLNADYVVAARSTKFVLAYSGIGLTPDCGVSYLLPRAIGLKRALSMAIGSKVLSAEQAEEWGLVSEVVDDDAVQQRAMDIAAQLASGPSQAWAETKRLFWEASESTRIASADDESRTIARLAGGGEAAGMIAKFAGK